MITTILACFIALFFAMNIGASGAAASMGIAYGSGAIKHRKAALLICGIGVFFGAIFGGAEVIKTIGSEIVPENIISIPIALIILSSASVTLFIANLNGIPLSTSEVTVGAVVGVGIAYNVLIVNTLLVIVMFWVLVPFMAFLLAYLMNSVIKIMERKLPYLSKGNWAKFLTILVIFTGFMEAFSAGMNNVANSVGPLVAAGLINIEQGTYAGGLFVALGVLLLGGKVIETNGKRITNLSLLQGSAISGIGATLVIIASIFGIPIPHTQVTTCSILGVGVSDNGRGIWKKAIVTKLAKTWILSPLLSFVISYNLVNLFWGFDLSGVVILIILIAFIY